MSFERTCAGWRDYRVGSGEQYCERCGTVAETVPHLAVAKVYGDSFRLGAKGVSCRSRGVNGTRRVDSQILFPRSHFLSMNSGHIPGSAVPIGEIGGGVLLPGSGTVA